MVRAPTFGIPVTSKIRVAGAILAVHITVKAVGMLSVSHTVISGDTSMAV